MRVSEIRVKRIRVNQGLGVWQKKILLLQQKLRDKHSEGIQIAKKILKSMFFFLIANGNFLPNQLLPV